jgi:glycine betaine/proline transport system permease protein
MMAVAMVVTASMIGARSLGNEVLLAINRLEVGADSKPAFQSCLLRS